MRPERVVGVARALQRRQRPAGERVHLERALDALRVGAARAAPRSPDRRARARRAAPASPSAAARASSSRAHRRDRPAAARDSPSVQRLEVEHRAADQQRQRGRARGSRAIARSASARKRAAEYASVGSTMSIRWCGTARARRRVGLRGADVHAAVDLRRVDADDLDRRSARRAPARARSCPTRSGPSAAPRAAVRHALAAAHEQPVEIGERQLVPRRPAVVALARRARSPPSRAAARSSPARVRLRFARTAPWQAIVDSSSSRCAVSTSLPPNSRSSCSTARASVAASASASGAGTPRTASVAGPSADDREAQRDRASPRAPPRPRPRAATRRTSPAPAAAAPARAASSAVFSRS